jgi:hypothetical protein
MIPAAAAAWDEGRLLQKTLKIAPGYLATEKSL